MHISNIHVKNYRSIREDSITLDRMLALVGPNGAGKSAWLYALALFYDQVSATSEDDFFNRNVRDPIEVSLTFNNLGETPQQLFAKYLVAGCLTVTKVVSWNDGRPRATYHGNTLQNPEFASAKAAFAIKDRGKTVRDEYTRLRTLPKYNALQDRTTLEDVRESLREWEDQHPTACTPTRDEGQFFGFTQVGQGYLGKFTRLLLIPAVRDVIRDISEGKASVFTQLLDLVIRSVLARRDDIATLEKSVNERYASLLEEGASAELSSLETLLTDGLQVFVPQATVQLQWQPVQTLALPMPTATVRLIEDDFSSTVDRCGHGLQRAFALVMLQSLAAAQQANAEEPAAKDGQLPHLVLVVEEPELFQHPNRQRHFSSILRQLATGATPGVADVTQVIYATHSPLFVGLDRIDDIRVLYKESAGEQTPRTTKAIRVDLNLVAAELEAAHSAESGSYSRSSLLPRLQALMTPWMNEGFFADKIVLVEGEEDRAAIAGMAHLLGVDLESRGISVLPCNGKTNIDRPLVIFRRLRIPVYPVWDGDSHRDDAKPAANHALLRLVSADVVDWPQHCGPTYTCFKQTLSRTIRAEIGTALYEAVLSEVASEFGYQQTRHAEKSPRVVSEVIRRAAEVGCEPTTLKTLMQHVVSAVFPAPATPPPEASKADHLDGNQYSLL